VPTIGNFRRNYHQWVANLVPFLRYTCALCRSWKNQSRTEHRRPWRFVIAARSEQDLATAIRQKLILEIAGTMPALTIANNRH
jgi:hypothetical protein